MRARLTPELVALIRASHFDGATVTECSRRYGVSWSHVKRIVTGQSWTGDEPRRRVNREAVRRIRELAAAGEKQDWIAAEFGISRSYVSCIVNRLRRLEVKDDVCC